MLFNDIVTVNPAEGDCCEMRTQPLLVYLHIRIIGSNVAQACHTGNDIMRDAGGTMTTDMRECVSCDYHQNR